MMYNCIIKFRGSIRSERFLTRSQAITIHETTLCSAAATLAVDHPSRAAYRGCFCSVSTHIAHCTLHIAHCTLQLVRIYAYMYKDIKDVRGILT